VSYTPTQYATQLADLQAQFIAGTLTLAAYKTALAAAIVSYDSIGTLADQFREVRNLASDMLASISMLNIRGLVTLVSDLPSDAADGDAYRIDNVIDPTTDGHVFARIDGVWVDLKQAAGPTGRSAYDIAVALGFVGTEADWLTYLQQPAIDAAALAVEKAGLANTQAGVAAAATAAADAKRIETEAVRAATEVVRVATLTAKGATETATAAAQTVVDASATLLAAKDTAVTAATTATTKAGQASDARDAALAAQSNGTEALASLNFLLRGIAGPNIRMGDPVGNYIFDLSPDGLFARLVGGSVTDAAFDSALLEDVLALRTLRRLIRYIPGAGLEIGDPAGAFTFQLGADGSLVLPGASVGAANLQLGAVGDAALNPALLDDILAIRALRTLIKVVPGGGLKIGDPAGAFTFQIAADGSPTASISAGAVGDSALSAALFEDVLALRALRQIVRFSPSDGLQIGSVAGDFTIKTGADGKLVFTFANGTVTRSTLATDVAPFVREKIASSVPGLVYAKTISTKRQVVRVTGAGEATISDGTANDDYPQMVGEAVRLTSDRDGGTVRAMRMSVDGKNLITELGSTKVYIIVGYGQSLSIGTSNSARFALTTANAASGVLMFNRGVRIIPGTPAVTDVVNATDIDHLVPLAAGLDGSAYGQTHVESLAYKLFAASGLRCIGLAAGVGGQSYTSLKKGTVPYANMIAAVQRARDVLAGLGYDCEVVVTWQHGEANTGTSRAVYKGYLAELSSDLNADIKPITGQAAVHLFGGQSPSLSQSQVPLALWEAGKENPLIHCVGPLYQFPLSDSQHPTSVGYYHLGEEYWRPFKAVVVDGGTWKPLQPVSATLSGSDIDLLFEGQVGNVVFETTDVAAITNYGLEYFDASGSPPAISSVTTIAGGVRVTLSTAPTGSGKVLRGAWTAPGATTSPQNSIPGARTNLADQDTLVSDYTGSKALPKRSVIFEIPVT
jgi:hypothetical protein